MAITSQSNTISKMKGKQAKLQLELRFLRFVNSFEQLFRRSAPDVLVGTSSQVPVKISVVDHWQPIKALDSLESNL